MEWQPIRISNLCFLFSIYISILLFSYGCSKGGSSSKSEWVPRIPGASELNHQSSTRIEQMELAPVKVPLLSKNSPMTEEYEATFDFMMNEDLGSFGSFSLLAEVDGIQLPHGVTPLLVSLTDGQGNEWVNLNRDGSKSHDCLRAGLDGTDCQITQPSAYTSRLNWQRRQTVGEGNLSVNTFPTCNWEGCAFNSTFFVPGTTQVSWGVGMIYTAKYVIAPNDQNDVKETGRTGEVHVTLAKKYSNTSDSKAIDLNIILVGSQNIQASRTKEGQRNLNSLFSHLATYLGQPNAQIQLGKIQVIEWGEELGGDAFARLRPSEVGQLFLKGGAILPSETEGKALNIYLISSIIGGSTGISGKINGPMNHETEGSGIALSSFNRLDRFNPKCTSGSLCPVKQQEEQFMRIATTLAHETSHYLGLLHTSESDGKLIDELPDTPHCTLLNEKNEQSQSTCRNDKNLHPITKKSCSAVCSFYDGRKKFCPEKEECEFNHLMWWGEKKYNSLYDTGDGHMISPASGILMNYHQLVQ